ncbi:MAG TPA: family 16 glycoside hydrolase [Opitutus sp.]|nr:family 16 glycoside hydrolase [Opitutus sp.]
MNKTPLIPGLTLLFATTLALRAAPDPNWLDHDRDRPAPTVVTPATPSTQEQPGRAPSDATVLFDGTNTSAWVAMDGSPTKWIVHDGALECVPGSGYARTLQSFGDCQLHVEWAAPVPPHGDSQGRGNSGVFFGFGRYEVQVLDSYQNKTYADGSAASVYGQYPPLVNASLPPGQWQTYDIIWTAPRFDDEGKLLSKAHVTVFQNGVLVQNNVELTGPTGWIGRAPYSPHPERLPIAFQDHGNPVRYRNVWVRELGHHRHKEFLPPAALLESYAGTYGHPPGNVVRIRLRPDGLLSLTLSNFDTVMHAESLTKFYGLATDVQCEFRFAGGNKQLAVTVGEDAEHPMLFERTAP